MSTAPATVKSAYKNCTAKDPSTCRYHGKRFARHPLASQFKSAEDIFIILDQKKIKPTAVIKKEELTEEVQNAEKWRASAKEANDTLTRNEKYVLHQYSDEYGSRNISTVLRNPDKQFVFATETSEQTWNKIHTIDRIIETHAVDVSEKTLWRGIKELDYEFKTVQVGDEIETPTYLSTSETANVAATFTPKEHPIVLKIKAKKAFPMANLLFDSEREMLVARQKRFKVVGIDENVRVETTRRTSSQGFLEGITVVSLEEV